MFTQECAAAAAVMPVRNYFIHQQHLSAVCTCQQAYQSLLRLHRQHREKASSRDYCLFMHMVALQPSLFRSREDMCTTVHVSGQHAVVYFVISLAGDTYKPL